MGISSVMVHWLAGLKGAGAFAGKSSVLDLGPQDVVSTPQVLASISCQASATASDVYRAIGLPEYAALDLNDSRASYRVDLNNPGSLGRTFDVITDFGTLEHVFNCAAALNFIHGHLNVGGLALHVLPTRGDYNHGFYNFHSIWFRDLAQANGYEIIGMVYVPDFGRQHERMADGVEPTLLNVTEMDDVEAERDFTVTSALRLVARRWFKNINPRIYDYIFAAMKKVKDSPFVMPQQGCANEASNSLRVVG